MSDRIDALKTWNEASIIERDAMRMAKARIEDLLDERAATDYPHMTDLDEHLRRLDRIIVQREARIAELEKRASDGTAESTRLSKLLRRQEDARQERAELVEARDALWRVAEAAGQVDLDDDQARTHDALTREIADIDEEIVARDQEIETEAALAAV